MVNMRLRGLVFAAALLAAFFSSSVPASDSDPAALYGVVPMPDNTVNHDPGVAIKGKNEFYPSRAGTDGRTVTPNDFEPVALCSGCHMDIYNQWKGSMHSDAWTDPVYRSALHLMSVFSHGKIDNFCMGCHTPIGVVSREATPDGKNMSDAANQGVQC